MTLLDPPAVLARSQPEALAWPSLLTLAYADVFDYPLTAAEAHRYLIGVPASPRSVASALASLVSQGRAEAREGFFTLPGRAHLVEVRRHRQHLSAPLWREARRYGRLLAALPFVRMVAVSGALAMDNVDERGDIDYFVVTEPGRLWTTRAFAVLLVRLARARGVTLCPNYLVTTRALELQDWNLFTAHELVQMVPLSGAQVYRRLRRLNRWTQAYLPNADGPPRPILADAPAHRATLAAERVLRARLFDPLERWEMGRKVRKFVKMGGEPAHDGWQEASFCEDWCKGHLDHHGQRALRAFERRVEALKEALE